MTLLKYFADDPDFHGMLDYFFERIALELRPTNMILVRIDNWFDWKWLGFAGTVPLDTFSRFGVTNLPTATTGVWKSGANTTVPPFTPSRIVRQDHFLCGNGTVCRPSEPILLHSSERRRNDPKGDPRILDVCDDGFIFWLSSDSASTGRGSLMAYHAKQDSVAGWYASFELTRARRWIVSRSRNMDRETLASLFNGFYEANE